MGAFLAAATGFPTVVFTAALVVVVLFWLLVALGAADAHGHAHMHLNSRAHGDGWGLGGVPVTLVFSLFVSVGWLISYCASVLLVPSGPVGILVGAAVLIGTVYVSWRATKLFVRPLHRLFPDEPGPSRLDFVGLTCTIRTGRVDAAFGQAEVRATDGSAAVVQVRLAVATPRRACSAVAARGCSTPTTRWASSSGSPRIRRTASWDRAWGCWLRPARRDRPMGRQPARN